MIRKLPFIFLFLLFISINYLAAQVDPYLINDEIDAKIALSLDHFSNGEYDEALALLYQVLDMDPVNKRANDLIESISELYKMEKDTDSEDTEDQEYIISRPDFNINDTTENGQDPEGENQDDENLEKPDFSVRDEDDDLIQPEETRSRFEFSLSPNLVLPWNIGEESVVFPLVSDYSMNINGSLDYYLNFWDRIFGLRAAYSLFLLNPEESELASDLLHVVDIMASFRTFFSESIDTRIILKVALGYRGYFSQGYNFYTINRTYLNGINMGVNLEAPLLYLFWDKEFFKHLIFNADMNLLFFPEMNTLNLWDFKFNGEYRFKNFSAGIHFGAYSVITPDEVEYLWMTGITFKLFF